MLQWSVQRAPEGTNTPALDTGYCIPSYARPSASEYPEAVFAFKWGIPVQAPGRLQNLRSTCANTVGFQVAGANSFWDVIVVRGGGEIVTGIQTLVVNTGAGQTFSDDLINTFTVMRGDFVLLKANSTFHRGPTDMGHTLELAF